MSLQARIGKISPVQTKSEKVTCCSNANKCQNERKYGKRAPTIRTIYVVKYAEFIIGRYDSILEAKRSKDEFHCSHNIPYVDIHITITHKTGVL